MRFSASIILSGLLATALAAPMPKKAKSSAAATATAAATNGTAAGTAAAAVASATAATGATTAAASGAGVLTAQSYADFQVSDGVAGNALDEVNAKFPVCLCLYQSFFIDASNDSPLDRPNRSRKRSCVGC